jgi:uncharacterized membrane protein HdeD (DUF308 family)
VEAQAVSRLRRLSGTHWAAIGLALSGIATQIGAMHTWQEAASPQAVAGFLQTIAAVLVAIHSDRPSKAAPSISPARFTREDQP